MAEDLTRPELVMGTVTSSITHDMLNVLATIQQSVGLMEDLLDLARKEKIKSLGLRKEFAYTDKFKSTIEMVRQQIARGMVLSENLNRFAHCPEDAGAACDLGEVFGMLVRLTVRICRRKNIRLEWDAPAGKTPAALNSWRAVRVLYAAIQAVLESASGVVLTVSTGQDAGRAWVSFAGLSPESSALAAEALRASCPEFAKEGMGAEVLPEGLRVDFPAP